MLIKLNIISVYKFVTISSVIMMKTTYKFEYTFDVILSNLSNELKRS